MKILYEIIAFFTEILSCPDCVLCDNHKQKCDNHKIKIMDFETKRRDNHTKSVARLRQIERDNHKKGVIITDGVCDNHKQKCDNHSTAETPTNAEVIGSAGVSAGEKSVRITGGLGGGLEGGSFNSNNNKNTVTADDVTCKNIKKEKINKKEKSKNARITLSDYSEDFETVWKIFPKKTEKEKSFELWQEYKKAGILPSLGFILEALKISSQEFGWEDMEEKRFIQSFRRWLHNKEWRSVEDKVNARLSRMKATEMQSKAQPATRPQTSAKEPTAAEIEEGKRIMREAAEKWNIKRRTV